MPSCRTQEDGDDTDQADHTARQLITPARANQTRFLSTDRHAAAGAARAARQALGRALLRAALQHSAVDGGVGGELVSNQQTSPTLGYLLK